VTPQNIIDGLSQKNRLLTQKNDEYVALVETRAQAERAYNISVATKTVELKAEGCSVTLIDKMVKGDRVVAELKYKLDVSEGVCKACLLAIKALTSQIDTYRSLLSWNKAELLRTE